MGPIGPKYGDFSKIPDDVKILILKYLDPKKIRNLAEVNKLWFSLTDKPAAWEEVAKKIKIKRNAKVTAKEDVIKYLANQISESHRKDPTMYILSYIGVQNIDPIQEHSIRRLFGNQLEGHTNFETVISYALGTERGDSEYNLTHGNVKLFQIMVEEIQKCKDHHLLQSTLIQLVLQIPESMPYIDVLLNAGVRPNAKAITTLATRINFETGAGISELKHFLDYTPSNTRERAIYFLENDKKISQIIKNAPPPTFGKGAK